MRKVYCSKCRHYRVVERARGLDSCRHSSNVEYRDGFYKRHEDTKNPPHEINSENDCINYGVSIWKLIFPVDK